MREVLLWSKWFGENIQHKVNYTALCKYLGSVEEIFEQKKKNFISKTSPKGLQRLYLFLLYPPPSEKLKLPCSSLIQDYRSFVPCLLIARMAVAWWPVRVPQIKLFFAFSNIDIAVHSFKFSFGSIPENNMLLILRSILWQDRNNYYLELIFKLQFSLY